MSFKLSISWKESQINQIQTKTLHVMIIVKSENGWYWTFDEFIQLLTGRYSTFDELNSFFKDHLDHRHPLHPARLHPHLRRTPTSGQRRSPGRHFRNSLPLDDVPLLAVSSADHEAEVELQSSSRSLLADSQHLCQHLSGNFSNCFPSLFCYVRQL